ncbi:cupin superfamily protein [Halopolyspora algeriensis]|uniref:Cupin superfamily protein n=1 Tax=Halopolyspora algeriensis TaxID=1500506 RepID=A0A368VVN3_9ACTN|nr:cupin domain-containing protein [Halopolyspora algeriensis]RCW45945.1 cupin superfamily protein [Halopolyspora algeriensis]TQM55358.1 cupin superfamily protein [Halopolyspora algeriensis]
MTAPDVDTESLRRCVGDPDRFAEQVWGRRVMVHGPTPDGFEDLLGLDDVDRLLSGYGLRTPAFRLVREGRVLPSSEYTQSARIGNAPMSGIADPARVFSAVEQGATLVLQGLQRYWPPLTRFCRSLELALGHSCQVNAYLTPPGSQGFHPHSDTHDVFVLQAFGRKTWQIWPAPAEHGGSGNTGEGPDEDGTADEHAADNVELVPGTAVYLPTGTRHAARTQHTLSGHLTVGIHPTRWRQVLERALTQLLDDPALEAPLPVGFHRDTEALATQLGERLEELGTRLEKLDARDVTDDLADRFLTGRPSLLHGGLVDRMRLATLDDDTRLRRRPGAVCEIRSGGTDPVRVLLGDRELRVPGWVEPAMREIAAGSTLTARDLASHLDPASRLVLLRRLVREGLLEVTDG